MRGRAEMLRNAAAAAAAARRRAAAGASGPGAGAAVAAAAAGANVVHVTLTRGDPAYRAPRAAVCRPQARHASRSYAAVGGEGEAEDTARGGAGAQELLRAGDVVVERRVFSADDVAAFAELTRDPNPIHAGAGAIVPGSLLASLFPSVIGARLPGALYLRQTLAFRSPLAVGAPVDARVEVTRASGRRLALRTEVSDAATGALLLDGDAVALLPAAAAPAARS